MSKETERVLLTAHFLSQWNPADGKIAWPNKDFTTPSNEMFVVFNILDRGTVRSSLGRTYLKRSFGSLQIDIYTPASMGTSRSRQIADRLENIYDSLDLVTSDGQSVVFGTPSSRVLPPNEQRAANLDDNWDRYVVDLPFKREQMVAK